MKDLPNPQSTSSVPPAQSCMPSHTKDSLIHLSPYVSTLPELLNLPMGQTTCPSLHVASAHNKKLDCDQWLISWCKRKLLYGRKFLLCANFAIFHKPASLNWWCHYVCMLIRTSTCVNEMVLYSILALTMSLNHLILVSAVSWLCQYLHAVYATHMLYYIVDFQIEKFANKLKLTLWTWTWYTGAIGLHVCTASQTITAVTCWKSVTSLIHTDSTTANVLVACEWFCDWNWRRYNEQMKRL